MTVITITLWKLSAFAESTDLERSTLRQIDPGIPTGAAFLRTALEAALVTDVAEINVGDICGVCRIVVATLIRVRWANILNDVSIQVG